MCAKNASGGVSCFGSNANGVATPPVVSLSGSTTAPSTGYGTGAISASPTGYFQEIHNGSRCVLVSGKWSCGNTYGVCLWNETTSACGKSEWYPQATYMCHMLGDYCTPVSATGSTAPIVGTGGLSGTGSYAFGSGSVINVYSSTGSSQNGGLNLSGAVCKDMFGPTGKFLYALSASGSALVASGPDSAFAGSGSLLDTLGVGAIVSSISNITSMSSFADSVFGIPNEGHEYCFF